MIKLKSSDWGKDTSLHCVEDLTLIGHYIIRVEEQIKIAVI